MQIELMELLLGARRGISHPNTDLDAQTFLRRVHQIREELGADPDLPVSYRPQVTGAELRDPRILIWDLGQRYEPARGNFDHHQDPNLRATPAILLQALGRPLSPLDQYVDLADRGHFFKEPQPHPFAETLQGLAAGINLCHRRDETRSLHYQTLLAWVEEHQIDPYSQMDAAVLPPEFRPFLEAKRSEERQAEQEADGARWSKGRFGQIAYLETGFVGAMPSLYRRGAALVILYDPAARTPGWTRSAPKFTLGANPALVAIPEQVDLRPLFAQLSAQEPLGRTWGGQAGIGGSPREEGGSGLSPEQVMEQVAILFG